MKKMANVLLLAAFLMISTGCGGKENTDKNAAAYTITLTHAVTEDTSQQAGSLAFKEYVEKNSKGKITVNLYPNAQMGGDREQIEGVQEGSITMMTCGSAAQANFVSSAIILDLPFAFASNEKATVAFTNPEFLKTFASEYDKKGFKLMGLSNLDFRVTTANVPIHKPEDLKGLAIRTMENKYHIALWKAMGANPTPLAFNELYTALQQHTVDGQENPMELVYAQKFYEQQKYVVKTRHLPQNLVWIMNKKFYNELPADLKTIVDGGAKAAMEAAAQFTATNSDKIEKELAKAGVKIIDLTPEEQKPFADATKGVWDMIKKDCEPAVYDSYVSAMK